MLHDSPSPYAKGFTPNAANPAAASMHVDGFSIGKPAIVCRWRLANRTLPLQHRHLRALLRRTCNGEAVSKHLVAWAKQHIEWTLYDGSAEFPDGVLMLVVDEAGKAAMTLGPYKPLASTRLSALCARAAQSFAEWQYCGVAPEQLWACTGNTLVWGCEQQQAASGANSLIFDLACTLGITVVKDPELLHNLQAKKDVPQEIFLVSDEHGVVVADGFEGSMSTGFIAHYEKLRDRAR